MKMKRLFTGMICIALAGLMSGCQYFSSTPDTAASTTASTTTTATQAARTTTALPSVGYVHYHATLLRSGAGLAYKAVDNGGLPVGTEVTILDKKGDWYYVKAGEAVGYVSGQFLRFTPWDPDAATTLPENTTTTTTAAITEGDPEATETAPADGE